MSSNPRVNPTHVWKQEIIDTYFPKTPIEIGDQIKQSDTKHDKTVVHIMARSRSTRLADKNIKPLCGVPLLAYTIIIAREMGADMILVDTDSKEYAKIANKYGAETPYLRPKELALDDTPPGLPVYYAQKRLLQKGYPVKTWVTMYPTSPFRNVHRTRKYYEILQKSGSLFTVFAPRVSFDTTPCLDREKPAGCHEDSMIFFKRTGNMLGSHLQLDELKWRHCEILNNPIELIDIDTDADFKLATSVIEANAYDFGVSIC